MWGILQDAALALEPIGHNLSLRHQLTPPPRAVPFDSLIDVSPPFGHQCSWVFEHGSWQKFGETWPTGLPRLKTSDDLPAHASDEEEKEEEDDVPVVPDEEEEVGDPSVDDGSDSATDDDDDDVDEDDVPVMPDEEEVDEWWADDF